MTVAAARNKINIVKYLIDNGAKVSLNMIDIVRNVTTCGVDCHTRKCGSIRILRGYIKENAHLYTTDAQKKWIRINC